MSLTGLDANSGDGSEQGAGFKREHPNAMLRRELARQLHGRGVEFGPGCHPLPLGPFVESLRFCDAFDRAGFAEHFPEVKDEIDGFPDPVDYLLDFDKQPFVEAIGAESLDFVVANHVLEHLVNPIRFLEQCRQLLKPNGILFVGQPDKRRMFDRDRRRTPLQELIRRYEAGESQVSEETVIEYVNQVDQPKERFDRSSPRFSEEVEKHRRRSLHVNVWLIDDLIELFEHLGRERQLPFELIDGAVAADEFLLLFRKAADSRVVDRYPMTMGRLWNESQRLYFEREFEPRLEELRNLSLRIEQQLAVSDERIRETQNFVRRIKSLCRKLPGAGLLERWFGPRN